MSYIEKHEVLCPADMGLGECRCMFKEYNERGASPPPDPALALLIEARDYVADGHSGFISGSGPDLKWQAARDKLLASIDAHLAARALLKERERG